MKLAIVDDNKLEQELIFNTLRTYEHERNISLDISSYSDGNSFLNTYVPGDFDLIFMDIYLNELNGIDIVRKIRQMDSKVIIVFLTTSKEHIFEAAPFHFFDYILKPFESTQIFHVLDDALALLPEQEAELSFEYRSFDVHFPLSKIQYIYSNNHEVIIHTTWNHVEYGLYYDNGIRLLRNDRFKVFSDQNERTQANPRAIYQIPVFET